LFRTIRWAFPSSIFGKTRRSVIPEFYAQEKENYAPYSAAR
jgi:hypothetical protein